jgi:uncharacterized protein (TIGR00725 family)
VKALPRRAQIAVSGGGTCSLTVARRAQALGREIAAAGAVLVCGGRGGVMAAAARGAAAAGGTVVGLLPGYAHADGNPYLSIVLPTGLGHARNMLVAAAGDALIALPGAHGTFAEVALARVLGRPVVVLGAWRALPGVVRARTPAEAVRRALSLARYRGSRAPRRRARQSRRGEGVPVPPRFNRLRSSGMALILRGRRRSQ